MRYHIKTKSDERIASFKFSSDRDACYEILDARNTGSFIKVEDTAEEKASDAAQRLEQILENQVAILLATLQESHLSDSVRSNLVGVRKRSESLLKKAKK